MPAQLQKSGICKAQHRVFYGKFKVIALLRVVNTSAGKKRTANERTTAAGTLNVLRIKNPVVLAAGIMVYYPVSVGLTRHGNGIPAVTAGLGRMYRKAKSQQRGIKLSGIGVIGADAYIISAKRPTEKEQSVAFGKSAATGRFYPTKVGFQIA